MSGLMPSRRMASSLLSLLAILLLAVPALARHGDIHATCQGNRPIVAERPPGTENVEVRCRNGVPEFHVQTEPVPTYDPVKSGIQFSLPPDFGGWVTVWLNGRPLQAPYNPIRRIQEPNAFLTQSTGRVMMPVRFFTEAFGGEVEWVQSERKARLFFRQESKVLQVWVGRSAAAVDLQTVQLDQSAVLYQDRVFVPLRFLMEGFGAIADWDHTNRSVRIQWNGKDCVSSVYCGEER